MHESEKEQDEGPTRLCGTARRGDGSGLGDGEAEEQAWPLVLLNSPRMSYVSGEVLWTDGGFQGAMETGKFTVPWTDDD